MIIPSNRTYPWEPGVTCGVRGGIPTGQTMFCDVTVSIPGYGGPVAAGDNATTTDGDAIQAAWTLCPAGQYVRVPAGDYLVPGGFAPSTRSGVVLRGDGPGLTNLKVTGSVVPCGIGSLDYPQPGRPGTGGGALLSAMVPVSGFPTSTSITVVDPATFHVGCFGRVDATVNSYVWPMNSFRNGGGYAMSYLVLVTGISGNQITFTPPLPLDLTGMTPKAIGYGSGGATPKFGCGLEGLTIDLSGATSAAALSWENVHDCWIDNVEITGARSRQALWNHAMFCEVRRSTWHNFIGAGGPGTEGFDLQSDCCCCLIEDNIVVNGGFPGIMLGDPFGGCWGNVIAYNFCRDVKVGATDTFGADIGLAHGSHNSFNLVEGNVAGGMQLDGYYGSSSHNTAHRNWFHGTHATATQGIRCIDVTHYNNYFNATGNELGHSTWTTGGIPYNDAPITSNYDSGASNGAKVLWRIGFPYVGGSSFNTTYNVAATTPPNYLSESSDISTFQFGIDANVAATLLRHGNFNHGYSSGPEWDSGIADHSLPNSLFRSSKPSWFGSLAWPPIDPATPKGTAINATFATTIPAAYRHVNGVDPDAGGGDDGGDPAPGMNVSGILTVGLLVLP